MICSTCHHEVCGETHLGYGAMDMHHAPTQGPAPAGYGTATWQWAHPYDGSYFASFIAGDGRREVLRVWKDGRREDVT